MFVVVITYSKILSTACHLVFQGKNTEPYKKPGFIWARFFVSLSQRLLDFGGAATADTAALLAGLAGQLTVGVKTARAA
jgi:hypothetical protein